MQNATMVPSGLTEHDLAERKNYITASDVPKVVGTSPWGTAYDVWLEKCGEELGMVVEPVEQSDAMAWGTLMEGPILTFAQYRLRNHLHLPSLRCTRVGIRRKHSNGCMSATLDARCEGLPDSIEAKTHAAIHPNINWDDWGEEFSDSVPLAYRDQCLAQLACAPDLERVWLVLSIARLVPTIYCIERKTWAARIAEIENTVCDFWDNHILTKTPPVGGPTMEMVKRVSMPIDPARIIAVDDTRLEETKRIAALMTNLEKQKKAIDASLRADMLGAALGRSPKGHTISFSTINRQGFSVEASSYQRMNVKLAVP